jgi:hypothetical protein
MISFYCSSIYFRYSSIYFLYVLSLLFHLLPLLFYLLSSLFYLPLHLLLSLSLLSYLDHSIKLCYGASPGTAGLGGTIPLIAGFG